MFNVSTQVGANYLVSISFKPWTEVQLAVDIQAVIEVRTQVLPEIPYPV